jgi:hypothetical protein
VASCITRTVDKNLSRKGLDSGLWNREDEADAEKTTEKGRERGITAKAGCVLPRKEEMRRKRKDEHSN